MTSFAQFSQSRLAILSDDSSDSGRGVFICPAHDITPQEINRLISLSGGIIFVALSSERSNAFMLSPMSRPRMRGKKTEADAAAPAMCISVEAREGVTTGISTADRATTLRILGEHEPNPRKLVRPGHIFPIEVRDGGVLVKNALPEAALDIVKAAGFSDAAVFIDILDTAGNYALPAEQRKIAEREKIPCFTLSDIVRHRLQTETLVQRVAVAKLPTFAGGELTSYIYKSRVHEGEHLALVKGEIHGDVPVLTRVQPEFTFADVFGGNNPPTRAQLATSLAAIKASSSGVLLYLRRPFAGQMKEQITAWNSKFQEKPASTMREYGLGAQILLDLGVRKIELLTTSSRNLVGLNTFGIEIVAQRPLDLIPSTAHAL